MKRYYLRVLFFMLALSLPLFSSLSFAEKNQTVVDLIVIEKSKRTLSTYHQGQLLKKYKIALGSSAEGRKEKEGDGKTPEGVYFISSKNHH